MTSLSKLSWTHNDSQRRWELGYNDPIEEMTRGDGRVVMASVTDEFIARAAVTREQLEGWIRDRFGVPLPPEAYATRSDNTPPA